MTTQKHPSGPLFCRHLRVWLCLAGGGLVAAGSGPDIYIPAPWEEVEGPKAEATIVNLAPEATGWTKIASSVRGKPIVAADFGGGPCRVYVVGSVSGDEPECVAAAELLRGELFKAGGE